MKRALRSLLLALCLVGCGSSIKSAHFVRPPLAEGGPRVPTPDAAFRDKAPATGASPAYELPVIVESRLSNGIRVLTLERHDFPIVTLRLVSSHGSDHAPLGVGAMWGQLVFRGPDGDDRGKISRAFAAHGADYRAKAANDASVISLQVLSGDYRRSVEILGEAIRVATFPASGLDEAREQQLSTLKRRGDSPQTVAVLSMFATLYPLGDRYHDDPGGTNETIGAVTREQLVAYHRAAMDAGRLAIAVAGDFDRKLLLTELEKDFGTLPDLKAPPLPKATTPEKSSAPRLVLVNRPGATQATVIVAALGVAYDHPDAVALEVLRTRLSSAVDFNLREEHAFTYGAGTYIAFYRRPGPVFVEGAIDKDHTGEAIELILAEIEKLRTDELSPKRLDAARDDTKLFLAHDFDAIKSVASALGAVGALDLPATYYTDLAKKLGEVTAADLQRVAKTYFAPDAVHIIVVGDSKALKTQLDALDSKVEVEAGAPDKPEPEPKTSD